MFAVAGWCETAGGRPGGMRCCVATSSGEIKHLAQGFKGKGVEKKQLAP